MQLNVTAKANDGRAVRVTAAQAKAIESISNTRKGGCASVHGYKVATGFYPGEEAVVNLQAITHFSQKRLYERKRQALLAIAYRDVAEAVAKDDLFKGMKAEKVLKTFDARKQMLLNQIDRNLQDKPKNAHQEGHVRCYAYFGDCKVHLVTETVDGIKQPVTDADGACECDSITVPYLELNKTIVKEGRRKTKKSGAGVVMGNYIEKCLNQRSVGYKTLSLKANNFESFKVDRMEFLPEDVASFGSIITE